MEVYGTGTIHPYSTPKEAPPPRPPEVYGGTSLVPDEKKQEPEVKGPAVQDQVAVGGGQEASTGMAVSGAVFEELNRKLSAAARGEPVEFNFLDFSSAKPDAAKPDAANPDAAEPAARAALEAGGIENPTSHHMQVYEVAIGGGLSSLQAVERVRQDPIVFDLNGDGDTNATVEQHGIEVDGARATMWAEQGDAVLAFGDEPLDTEGGKYQDAYANLRAKAHEAGIDVSKGYLDESDLQVLQGKGLTLMVSQGDGTNVAMKPTELGITKMTLGGRSVQQEDIAGNLITTQGSFTRNGQEQVANDMWLNTI